MFEILCSGDIPATTEEDVNVVVDAAHKALKRNGGKEWASTSGDHHAKYFHVIDSKIVEKKSELAKLEVVDCGKPLVEAAWDMVDVAGCFDYNADLAEELDRKQNAFVSLPMDTFKCHLIRLMICQECSDYFPKIPHGLDSVSSMFKQHVAAEGTTLVKQAEDVASNKKAEKRLQVDPVTWPIMIFRVC
uniref:Aldehyde dehydrogenase domain-containing protein n=1 Tax=Lactuca sativa TaxID=4236 RepID=A0A9R1VXP7_LACSA|nr:hypothetical protein LSAT_V11C400184350 [Lactuca sativa]